jgi:DsbC/DsbD-like thiol-disulfide interchange protein
MTTFVPTRMVAVFAGFAVCTLTAAAGAEDSSPWIRDTHSAVRLIAGSRSGNVLLGGIGFDIQQGWKTYWRTPGDSGVPPRIDFSKSDNVESVTILWPAPLKFADGAGGTSFGYHNQVVLPLRIVAKNADSPVTLRASINYAVCEKLCLPVDANAELKFVSETSTEDSTIAAALDTVPKPAKVGDQGALAIRGVKRDGKVGVTVDVIVPDGKDAELFVEGPTPEWALPAPKLINRANGIQRFAFDLDGLPSGVSPDSAATLKLTLTSGNAAYEYNVALK